MKTQNFIREGSIFITELKTIRDFTIKIFGDCRGFQMLVCFKDGYFDAGWKGFKDLADMIKYAKKVSLKYYHTLVI